MLSKARLIMRSRRPAGRLTFKDTARAGIVEWDPAKIADRSFMIVDEMEALQSKLESWCKTDPRKLIIFDNCENIFQDEQSAQENCWLHNLALTYDFDLNKVEQSVYVGHALVNEIFTSPIPIIFFNQRPAVGYGKAFACAAQFCVDSSKNEYLDSLDHFDIPGVGFFADWKIKFDLPRRDIQLIRAALLKLTMQEDVSESQIDELMAKYPTSFTYTSDFCYNTINNTTSHDATQLPHYLGHDYLGALSYLEDKKRHSFDEFHYNNRHAIKQKTNPVASRFPGEYLYR